jgi:hypothetical protein
MDVTFDEDRCRTRKDDSPLNLAVIRHAGFNILQADNTAVPCDANASEPASTQCSEPSYSPLNDLGFCPAPGRRCSGHSTPSGTNLALAA